MFNNTKVALSAAIVLSTAFPASAATSIIASPMFIRRFITWWSPPPLVAAVRRLVAQLAVAIARDLVLVHHQIETDDGCGREKSSRLPARSRACCLEEKPRHRGMQHYCRNISTGPPVYRLGGHNRAARSTPQLSKVSAKLFGKRASDQ